MSFRTIGVWAAAYIGVMFALSLATSWTGLPALAAAAVWTYLLTGGF